MISISELHCQLKLAHLSLKEKYQLSGEIIILDYIKKYEAAIEDVEKNSKNITVSLNGIVNCTRGYMETSSNFKQDFLNEMHKSEKMAKLFLDI